MAPLRNCLTVDLESVSHRYVTERRHLRKDWKKAVEAEESRKALDNGRTPVLTRLILRALAKHDQAATFFVVGEIYDWYPDLVDEIHEEGHEVAYHSHTHTPFNNSSSLQREMERSVDFLEKYRPEGFRSARASITPDCLHELARRGFIYDSSTYGPFSSCAKVEGIIEVPISTYPLRRERPLTFPRQLSPILLRDLEIPFGSGYFISLLSLISPTLISHFIEKSSERGVPSILCLHPWQLGRKRLESTSKLGLAHLGLLPYDIPCDRAFNHLIRNHRFCAISEMLQDTGIL